MCLAAADRLNTGRASSHQAMQPVITAKRSARPGGEINQCRCVGDVRTLLGSSFKMAIDDRRPPTPALARMLRVPRCSSLGTYAKRSSRWLTAVSDGNWPTGANRGRARHRSSRLPAGLLKGGSRRTSRKAVPGRRLSAATGSVQSIAEGRSSCRPRTAAMASLSLVAVDESGRSVRLGGRTVFHQRLVDHPQRRGEIQWLGQVVANTQCAGGVHLRLRGIGRYDDDR